MLDPNLENAINETQRAMLDLGEIIFPADAFLKFRKIVLDAMGHRGLKRKLASHGMGFTHRSGGNFVGKAVGYDCSNTR